ncbi:hypothetical protein F5Y11DRAFT_321069 [Daldinia sp. FL1419]|nr:hypothetical protein F5Y11DRAFT_321069 [Daldinia sp. FL1419]
MGGNISNSSFPMAIIKPIKRRFERTNLPNTIMLTIEVILVPLTLILMWLAYLEKFQRPLWEVGGQNGWNSRSHLQQLSESNLAISGLAIATRLARLILVHFNTTSAYSCLFDVLNDIMLLGFWIYSVAAQCSNDLAHLNRVIVTSWHLEKGCTALNSMIVGDCILARICFVFSVLSM